MALSADTPITITGGDYRSCPVAASTKIYEGALVGQNSSGDAGGLSTSTFTKFIGHAFRQADNSAGAAGAITVRCKSGKYTAKVVVTGVDDEDDVGKAVYASDDGTLTLTKSTNIRVGVVIDHVTSTTCIVQFETDLVVAALLADPTSDAAIAAIATIIDVLQDAGLMKTA